MMGASYKTKKELKEAIGQPLRYVRSRAFAYQPQVVRKDSDGKRTD